MNFRIHLVFLFYRFSPWRHQHRDLMYIHEFEDGYHENDWIINTNLDLMHVKSASHNGSIKIERFKS